MYFALFYFYLLTVRVDVACYWLRYNLWPTYKQVCHPQVQNITSPTLLTHITYGMAARVRSEAFFKSKLFKPPSQAPSSKALVCIKSLNNTKYHHLYKICKGHLDDASSSEI